jgi:hypothetical protein
MKDLVLGAKVDLNTSIIKINGDFCYTKCGSGGSVCAMGRLLISRADYRATSARRRTTAHPTVVRRFLCSGYVVSKKVSCVLMNMILVTIR